MTNVNMVFIECVSTLLSKLFHKWLKILYHILSDFYTLFDRMFAPQQEKTYHVVVRQGKVQIHLASAQSDQSSLSAQRTF